MTAKLHTKEELDAIWGRRAALKSIPWQVDHRYRMFVGERHAVRRHGGDALITGLAGVITYTPATKKREFDPYGADDAEFIANAPEDVDTLREHIGALEGKIRDYEEAIHSHFSHKPEVSEEN